MNTRAEFVLSEGREFDRMNELFGGNDVALGLTVVPIRRLNTGLAVEGTFTNRWSP